MQEHVDRLNESARRALDFAEEEAHSLGHNYIGTEHILLGLIREEDGVAQMVLRGLGVELEEAREAVVQLVGRGSGASDAPISLTPRAAQVLVLAADYAGEQKQADTHHILLAILRGRDDRRPGPAVAISVLESFGVTDEAVDSQLSSVLAETGKGNEAGRLLATGSDESKRRARRYSLVLPAELFEEVEQLAEKQQTSVVELLRRFTRLGLLAVRLQEREDAALIIRQGDSEQRVLLL